MKPHELFWGIDAKRLLIGGAVVVALVVAGRCGLTYMFTSGEAHSAQERVRRVLDGMKPGGNMDQAISLWYLGSFHLPGGQTQFDEAATAFEAWQRQRNLGRISTFEITEARVTKETGQLGQATAEVSGTIEGTPFKVRVVSGEPIAWVE